MLVRLWQVSGTVRAVSRRLRALVDTHCETALEPLRQILRPLCSDAVVERLARTRDDRKGLFAQASDSVRPSVLRKVDGVAVGIPDAGFRLAVGRSFLDVGRGAPLLAHRNQGLDALHLETEMIDPLLELISFDFAFGADRDDRQV